ncbi:hypothetical protein VP01_699g7 [Puccinia sorghi]|uniref:LIM zinc-binding domain-containing protein n=1 Tax=Puccinia sorghi TaxID=27349 RepID=A0A0L6UDV0_9BASI|nr:hypothetical protein VP01_699g7 [Puccinia sorghi]
MSTPLLRRLAQYQQPPQQQQPQPTAPSNSYPARAHSLKRPLPPVPPPQEPPQQTHQSPRTKPLPQPPSTTAPLPQHPFSPPPIIWNNPYTRPPHLPQPPSLPEELSSHGPQNWVTQQPPIIVHNASSDHDDAQEGMMPRMVVTDSDEGAPAIVVDDGCPPASPTAAEATTMTKGKKPFISDGRRTAGPRTITPQRSERVTSESRTRQRSMPQTILPDITPYHHQHASSLPHHRHPPHHAVLTCAGCQQLIAGRIVNALDRRWHPDCFTCQHCNIVLEHVAFYEHEGKAYCGVDYDELFSVKCYHCNTSINEDSYVTLDDPSIKDGPRHYHKLHLFCSECGDPFIDPKSLEERSRISHLSHQASEPPLPPKEPKPFVLFNGFPYCEKCDIRLHRPKCFACKLPIPNDFVAALNKRFHSECFVCFQCQHAFSNNQFFLKPLADIDPSLDPKSKLGTQPVPICLNCYS